MSGRPPHKAVEFGPSRSAAKGESTALSALQTQGRTLLKWRRPRPETCLSAPKICLLKPLPMSQSTTARPINSIRSALGSQAITSINGRDVQAIFRRRRHQPRRPPLPKIRPGSPAPTMGAGKYPPRCGHDLSGEQNSYFDCY